MSYSFSISAPSKAEAKEKVTAAFDNVVLGQPTHAADRDAGVACGHAFVDALVEPGENDEVYVHIYGSLSWRGGHNKPEFTSANISVTASIRAKG